MKWMRSRERDKQKENHTQTNKGKIKTKRSYDTQRFYYWKIYTEKRETKQKVEINIK